MTAGVSLPDGGTLGWSLIRRYGPLALSFFWFFNLVLSPNERAIYFGFDCEQIHTPIVERLTRRDRDSESEWAYVQIDSRNDGKSAYLFAVNISGVLADAQIIAARAQGCLLVTRRHHTRLSDVEEVKSRLQPTGAQLLGAVISE